MKRILCALFLFTGILIFPTIAYAADDVNQAYENGDLVIESHWERLPWHQNSSDVPWPGEDALDNWYDSDEVWNLGVFEYVYDVYYLGEKVDPDVIWVSSTVPTSTFCTPIWNEETQQFDPEFDEDGTGSFKIWSFSLADNASKKAPIKGSLSEENIATIPTWKLIPYDLTNSDRVRIVYDGIWNNNEDFVSYTGEAYPLTFWSTWEEIENPMYTIYWTDADGNEILLDKGYDYAGRAINNIDVTTDPTNQTTWAKPVLLGVYNFCGRYVPENGDFYIKGTEPPVQSKVQVVYKVGNTIVKTTDVSIEPINMDEQAPQIDNLAYWSHQSTPGYNPVVSPIEGQDLNLVTTYAVLHGQDGKDGEQGPQGEKGEKGDSEQNNNINNKNNSLSPNIKYNDNTNTKKVKMPPAGDALYAIRLLIVIILLAAGIIILTVHKKNKLK